ncbi:hypothetical protein LCGC14_2029560, partial [marine sediment metagenome]
MTKKRSDKRTDEPADLPVGDGAEGTEIDPAPRPAAEQAHPEDLQAQRDDLMARLQRVSADYLNYQKRVQRDISEARDFANADLIGELLAMLDDMERALQAARANHGEDDPLLTGMQLVYDKALDVLARHGLTPIDSVGQPFDPTCHEAMMQQPSSDHDSPAVLTELQRGYRLKGRVLRPARVIVSAPSDPEQAEP